MDPLDLPELLKAYGGPGLAILILILTVRALWTRLLQVTDARHADQRDHTQQLVSSTETLRRALDVVEGRPRG